MASKVSSGVRFVRDIYPAVAGEHGRAACIAQGASQHIQELHTSSFALYMR
jgi:hypothetical protein